MLNSPIEIENVLAKGAVTALYQPLVSVRRKRLFGFEALGRGLAKGGGLVSPGVLFELAGAAGKRLELDRVLRDRAFDGFVDIHDYDRELMLSVNIETSLIDAPAAQLDYICRQVERAAINPNNVIIELIESKVKDTSALLKFIDFYRAEGFLIALDDVGAGHSNLNRVAELRPDVIKIDRGLITNIDDEFYKLEVARSLVQLGRKIGALVVGEGVETANEGLTLLELGVDVLQGFYFSPPIKLVGGPKDNHWEFQERIAHLADKYRAHVLGAIDARNERVKAWERVMDVVVTGMSEVPDEDHVAALIGYISRYPEVECLYLLNADGTQIGDTVCNPYHISEQKRFLFQPARCGTDHSLKDYFLPLRAGLERHITEPYVSLASGNLCTTLSATYQSLSGHRILCMDVSLAGEGEGQLMRVCSL